MLLIKQKRLQLNLTQSDLAKAVNVSKGFICNIENGNRKPSYEMMIKLAQFLNVAGEDLLKQIE